ncbi:MAG: hypothetical protein RH942_09515 [Kiloniellaceae bacterium]
MIPSSQEILYRVFGAWRLARFDAGGAQYFDDSPEAALRSFFAAALVAPAFFVTLLVIYPEAPAIGPLPVILIRFLAYVLLWSVFPVIAHRICQVIGAEQAFFRYLAADNWAGVIAYHLQLVVLIAAAGGFLPVALSGLLQLSVHIYLVAYSWFIARHCLAVSGPAAAGFVVLQLVIGLLIQAVASGIIYETGG